MNIKLKSATSCGTFCFSAQTPAHLTPFIRRSFSVGGPQLDAKK